MSSCSPHENLTDISFNTSTNFNRVNRVVKTWVYVSDNVWVSCIIKINPDSTFNYENTGCMGTVYSSGKWTIKGNQLVLNSFDVYAPKTTTFTAKETMPAAEAGELSKTTHITDTSCIKQFTLTINPTVLSTSFIPCDVNFDSLTTYFKDRIFILESDTLFELSGQFMTQSRSKFCAAKNLN